MYIRIARVFSCCKGVGARSAASNDNIIIKEYYEYIINSDFSMQGMNCSCPHHKFVPVLIMLIGLAFLCKPSMSQRIVRERRLARPPHSDRFAEMLPWMCVLQQIDFKETTGTPVVSL